MNPILYIVVPCFNEEKVLPITAPFFLDKIEELVGCNKISHNSRVLFVDDGSRDTTWNIISSMARDYPQILGVKLLGNSGTKNAINAGFDYVKEKCDCVISVHCDGQDDINVIDKMIEEYVKGFKVVLAVASKNCDKNPFIEKVSKQCFKFKRCFGSEKVYNHFDYKLLSSEVLKWIDRCDKGTLPIEQAIDEMGITCSRVAYQRHKRINSQSKTTKKQKNISAFNNFFSMTHRPLHIITLSGFAFLILSVMVFLSFCVISMAGIKVQKWGMILNSVCFFEAVQIIFIGIIGEYVSEILKRNIKGPKFIIEEITENTEK